MSGPRVRTTRSLLRSPRALARLTRLPGPQVCLCVSLRHRACLRELLRRFWCVTQGRATVQSPWVRERPRLQVGLQCLPPPPHPQQPPPPPPCEGLAASSSACERSRGSSASGTVRAPGGTLGEAALGTRLSPSRPECVRFKAGLLHGGPGLPRNCLHPLYPTYVRPREG